MTLTAAKIKSILLDHGFDKVGITAAEALPGADHLERWLENGFHGTMDWMERWQEKRRDVLQLAPWAKSVVSVAQNYYTPQKHSAEKQTAKISRYAWGQDYHKIIKKKLKQALVEMKEADPQLEGRLCVDTAPIMDKLWAQKAGIGWQGKHTNIITREMGSWVFLGELILNMAFEYDLPATDHCGSCTACIEACPTDAIVEPYVLDGSRCISYLTIEYRGKELPDEFKGKMDNWAFGCDICQDVCPWNRFAVETAEQRYQPEDGNVTPAISELENLSAADFKKRFKKSPVSRTGWDGLKRNARFLK